MPDAELAWRSGLVDRTVAGFDRVVGGEQVLDGEYGRIVDGRDLSSEDTADNGRIRNRHSSSATAAEVERQAQSSAASSDSATGTR
jgi:hypothetical protein